MGLTAGTTNWGNKKFIPQSYSLNVLKRFYAKDILMGVTNTNFPELKFGKKGDTVHIRKEPKFVFQDHQVDTPNNFDLVNDEEITLSIDYDKVCAARLPSEWQKLSDIDLKAVCTAAMEKAYTKMIQQIVFQGAYASATSTVASSDWQTAGNASKAVMDAKVYLDNLEVPAEDRWLLVSPAMTKYLALETANYAQNMGTDKGALFDGFVGYYAGFRVYQTPYLAGAGTAASPWEAMAGHKDAISLAANIKDTAVVDLRSAGHLADGIIFNALFGYGVTQPDALVRLRAQTAA